MSFSAVSMNVSDKPAMLSELFRFPRKGGILQCGGGA
jgi:ubiquinone/menaquinone biosynthesis C-methylase UbiE